MSACAHLCPDANKLEANASFAESKTAGLDLKLLELALCCQLLFHFCACRFSKGCRACTRGPPYVAASRNRASRSASGCAALCSCLLFQPMGWASSAGGRRQLIWKTFTFFSLLCYNVSGAAPPSVCLWRGVWVCFYITKVHT